MGSWQVVYIKSKKYGIMKNGHLCESISGWSGAMEENGGDTAYAAQNVAEKICAAHKIRHVEIVAVEEYRSHTCVNLFYFDIPLVL